MPEPKEAVVEEKKEREGTQEVHKYEAVPKKHMDLIRNYLGGKPHDEVKNLRVLTDNALQIDIPDSDIQEVRSRAQN